MGGAAVLDDPQAPRRDLVGDAVVEEDHAVGDVLLEAVAGEGVRAPLAGDDRRHALLLEPAEQAAQLGPEDGLVGQPCEERLDGVEDDALGADRVDRVAEPDEEAVEVVLARLLDLAALDVDVIDGELLLSESSFRSKPSEATFFVSSSAVSSKAMKTPGSLYSSRAVDEELHGEQRLAGACRACDEGRPPLGQTASGDLVETLDACRRFFENIRLNQCPLSCHSFHPSLALRD